MGLRYETYLPFTHSGTKGGVQLSYQKPFFIEAISLLKHTKSFMEQKPVSFKLAGFHCATNDKGSGRILCYSKKISITIQSFYRVLVTFRAFISQPNISCFFLFRKLNRFRIPERCKNWMVAGGDIKWNNDKLTPSVCIVFYYVLTTYYVLVLCLLDRITIFTFGSLKSCMWTTWDVRKLHNARTWQLIWSSGEKFSKSEEILPFVHFLFR